MMARKFVGFLMNILIIFSKVRYGGQKVKCKTYRTSFRWGKHDYCQV